VKVHRRECTFAEYVVVSVSSPRSWSPGIPFLGATPKRRSMSADCQLSRIREQAFLARDSAMIRDPRVDKRQRDLCTVKIQRDSSGSRCFVPQIRRFSFRVRGNSRFPLSLDTVLARYARDCRGSFRLICRFISRLIYVELPRTGLTITRAIRAIEL